MTFINTLVLILVVLKIVGLIYISWFAIFLPMIVCLCWDFVMFIISMWVINRRYK